MKSKSIFKSLKIYFLVGLSLSLIFQYPIHLLTSQVIFASTQMGDFRVDNEDISFFQQEIEALSEREAQIQEELFQLSRDLDELYREQSELEKEIEEVEAELTKKSQQVDSQEEKYRLAQKDMGSVLQSLQKLGPVSYLELLLTAENWEEFLLRIDVIRNFVIDARRKIENLIAERDILLEQEAELEATLVEKEQLEEDLIDQINKIEEKYQQQEEILTEVKEKREAFETRMEKIDDNWEDARSTIQTTMDRTSELIKQGEFDMENIEISGSLFSPNVKIPVGKFSDILETDPDMPALNFDFESELILLHFPEDNTHLFLEAEPVNESEIELFIERVEFMGFSLPENSIDNLNQQFEVVFDFEALLAGYKIDTINIQEDAMELELTNGIFSKRF